MDRGLAVLLMAIVGGLIAMQPAVNAGLGRATGNVAAALVSFAIGALLLAVIAALAGQAAGLAEAFSVPWYYLLGGVLGAAYVFTALVTVSSIGAGGVAAATITGQLTLSIVLDKVGFLGLDETTDHGRAGARRRPAARRHLPHRPLAAMSLGGGKRPVWRLDAARRLRERRVSDLQIMAERPVDEAAALHRLERRGEHPRRHAGDQLLRAQHPLELPFVASREVGVAAQRGLSRRASFDDAAQLAPAGDAEVKGRADALRG